MDGVLELTHIPRVIVVHQGFQRLRRDLFLLLVWALLRVLFEEVQDQDGDILTPLPERPEMIISPLPAWLRFLGLGLFLALVLPLMAIGIYQEPRGAYLPSVGY